jgi:hypothetical protein
VSGVAEFFDMFHMLQKIREALRSGTAPQIVCGIVLPDASSGSTTDIGKNWQAYRELVMWRGRTLLRSFQSLQ